MEALEIIDRISNGEDSFTQFKREMTDSNKLAEELVAFSNAEGGVLLIGVEDNGDIVGVNPDAIGKLNLLISNTSNENVKPPIYPLTEIVEISDKKIVVISVRKGESKPYQTNKGLYLTKSGSDKRKMSQEELRRLFAESKRLFADEEVLEESTLGDLNTELFYSFLEKDDPMVLEELKQEKLDLETVLENREIFKNGSLTLAGNLIFGKKPQRFSPSFYVDCVYFDGNDTTVSNFVSKATINGTLEQMYKESLNFVKSNLRRKQVEKDFNTQGELEIDERILTELIVNALVHRDYYIQSSVKIFMFHNRVEIISPGKLANSLTVAKIKSGISIHRNPILNSIGKIVLPYSGYGSGIKRALSLDPTIEFLNDTDKEEFKCIIKRDDSTGEANEH